MRSLFVAGLLGVSFLFGCTGIVDSHNQGTTGDDDTTNTPDGGTPVTVTPHLAAAIDKSTVATALGATTTLTVSLVGSGDFAGPVTLTPTVVDGGGAAVVGWTFTQTPTTLTLDKNGTATASIAVVVPTDSASLTATVNVAVAATGVTVPSVTSAYTVANTYTVHIAAGTGTGSHAADFPKLLKLKSGATLIFQNDDNIKHTIHADGGFPHEPLSGMAPGANYTVVPTGDTTFYCHDHNDGSKNNLSYEP